MSTFIFGDILSFFYVSPSWFIVLFTYCRTFKWRFGIFGQQVLPVVTTSCQGEAIRRCGLSRFSIHLLFCPLDPFGSVPQAVTFSSYLSTISSLYRVALSM